MANTIYYGISQTAASEQVKRVVLEDANFNPNNLVRGDILSVYFSQRNDADNPTLALYIGDAEQDLDGSGAEGKITYNADSNAVLKGAWTDGEVVNFSYTYNGSVVENADQVTYWEMVGKPVATNETYGDVKIDDTTDDSSAASIGLVKELLGEATTGKLTYTSAYENAVGDLTLGQYDEDNQLIEGTESTVQITIPNIPNDTGELEFNSAGYITNAITGSLDFTDPTDGVGQQLKADGDIIIDLKENGTDNVIINGLNDIVLNPEGQVVIGSQGDNDNLTVYGNIYANNLDASGITVDTIGAHNTTSNLITFTSPTNLENTVTMNGGIYIGNQTLEDYITSLFDSGENEDAIGAAAAGLFHDYLKTQRYYSRDFTATQGEIRYVVFGDQDPDSMTDTTKTAVHTNRNLNISGYDIVGVIAWEAWMGGNKSTPKNANIYGIWWQNNDTSTGNLYLKVTGLDDAATSIKTSVDILYKRKTYAITYDLDGGVNGPSTQYKFHDHNIKVSRKVPTKEGYSFIGWETNGAISTSHLMPGDTYSYNQSITLKADWI